MTAVIEEKFKAMIKVADFNTRPRPPMPDSQRATSVATDIATNVPTSGISPIAHPPDLPATTKPSAPWTTPITAKSPETPPAAHQYCRTLAHSTIAAVSKALYHQHRSAPP
ncbi:hypothetical protein F0562_019608 [Nyssa sinensis]|uniref:Uncharacterized protein n=1 Tax=Nyssa sinensis TaxID=561372 RepID=A0A5J5BU46_9ASTE|nr:hypothetical protein F0562_019608 [Nyssa sinensis]